MARILLLTGSLHQLHKGLLDVFHKGSLHLPTLNNHAANRSIVIKCSQLHCDIVDGNPRTSMYIKPVGLLMFSQFFFGIQDSTNILKGPSIWSQLSQANFGFIEGNIHCSLSLFGHGIKVDGILAGVLESKKDAFAYIVVQLGWSPYSGWKGNDLASKDL